MEFKASATTTAEETDDSGKKNIEDEKAKKAAALKAKKAAEAKAKKEAEAKAAKEAAENAEEPEEAEEEESSGDESPSVTIEQIKSMMAKKISDHRDDIKKQMTKIGAQNLSTISADQYDSFYSFLEGLD